MRSLFEPTVTELDPETQAAVDEVCGALEWFNADDPGAVEYMRVQQFRGKWRSALRHAADPECRQKVCDAVDAIVRADEDVVITTQGYLFTRGQIGQYRGRWVYERQPDGEMRSVLQWPTGTYASGEPSFETPEGRAA